MTVRSPHTDQELFLRIAEGDEDAFSVLFHQYIGILKPFVISYTKTEEEANELVQDTFIRIWLFRDKLPGIVNPKAWIFKVASNECFRFLRKQLAATRMSDRVQQLQPNSDNSAEEYLNVREIKRLVGEAVRALAPQRRNIYQMSREQGLKIDEIAAELGLSANTVKNVLVTSAKLVREYLEAAGYYLPFVLVLLLIE